MLKRFIPFALALLSCSALSCDRQQTAELILSVGINSVTDSPLASLQENIPEDGPREASYVRQAAEILLEMRSLAGDGSGAGSARHSELIDQIRLLASTSEEAFGSGSQLVIALREAELAALREAAQSDPGHYGPQRDDLHRWLIEQYAAGAGSDRSSVQRVLEVLARRQITQQARDFVALHAASYPDCEMNVELYLSAITQYSNQQRLVDAIEVAEEGVQLCQGLATLPALEDRLRELNAEIGELNR